jgi:hypothetical protein
MEELFANQRFSRLLAEPYQGQELPIEFTRPSWLAQQSICRLPGAYGNYTQELFAPDMVAGARIPAALPGANPAPAPTQRPRGDGCGVFEEATVVQLGDTAISATGVITSGETLAGAYCLPQPGDPVPEESLRTIYTWRLPAPDPSEQVTYRWEGMAAQYNGAPVLPIRADLIPPCTQDMLAVFEPPVPGGLRMPDLERYGENQAKDILAAMGITNVFVDYQTRDRIPDIFDDYAPYAVVSSLPAAGEWVTPDMTIVLGIRAPEE